MDNDAKRRLTDLLKEPDMVPDVMSIRRDVAQVLIDVSQAQALLIDIEKVIKERAIGHSIMYSDRLTPFLPRIEEFLK